MAQRRKEILWAEECQPLTNEQMDNIKSQFHPQANGSNINITPYHIYSTTEHIVGEWTNGKTLYEKTISFSLPASANVYKTIATLTGADKVRGIDWGGVNYDSNNQAFIDFAIYFNYVYASNAFQIATTSAFGEKNAVVTVRYTKTAD